MDRDQIWKQDYIPALARMALEQSEKRLSDLLDIRKSTESKITSLFGIYLSISMAIFGIGAALTQRDALAAKAVPLFLIGGVFVLAAMVLGYGLWPRRAAMLGIGPGYFLASNSLVVPEGDDDQQAARTIAVAAVDLAALFPIQEADNTFRQKLLRTALIMGVIGAILFGVVLYRLFA